MRRGLEPQPAGDAFLALGKTQPGVEIGAGQPGHTAVTVTSRERYWLLAQQEHTTNQALPQMGDHPG